MSSHYYNLGELEFYDYLSKKLNDYFENNISKGERYFIEFNEEEQVHNFHDSLKRLNRAKEKKIQHIKGDIYETFYLDFNGIRLLIADTLDTNSHYLNLLRNEIGKNKLSDYSLLIIAYQTIESVKEMKNLKNKGYPLNLEYISKNLHKEIDESPLSDKEKWVLKFYLNKKEEYLYQTTLWDYEDILSILSRDVNLDGENVILDEEYYKFGLFPDKHLDPNELNDNDINDRIKINFDTFEFVKSRKESSNSKEELEKKFDEDGIKCLRDEEWWLTDFKLLNDSMDRFKENDKALKYYENKDKVTNEGLTYWERANSKNNAGTKFILVFNDKKEGKVSFDLEFSSDVDKSKFKQKDLNFVKTNKNFIKVNIDANSNDLIFKRFDYEHNNRSKFKFFILILPFDENFFTSIKTSFFIKNPKITSDNFYLGVIRDDNEDIKFGKGAEKIIKVEDEQDLIYSSSELNHQSIIISNESPGWANASLDFNLIIDNINIPIKIEENKRENFPYKSVELWKLKRENEEDIIFNGVKAIQGSKANKIEKAIKPYLEMEKDMIDKEIFHGFKDVDDEIKKINLNINPDLERAYQEIFDCYKEKDNVPSLVFLKGKLKEKYENFIELFNNEIRDIVEKTPLSNQENKLDLLKIGLIIDNNRILFSSLSPLNIAYQLEINKQLKNEVLDKTILETLTPNNLVPYIFDKNRVLYKPFYQTDAHEWLEFKRDKMVSIGTTNAFISGVVTEKIKQFTTDFGYLFTLNNKSPVILNIININDDSQLVKGIFDFIKHSFITNGEKAVIPVEVNIYSNVESSLEQLFKCKNKDQLDKVFKTEFRGKKQDEIQDIIRLVQDNIKYYKHPKDVEKYSYAHISFYYSGVDGTPALYSMENINTGLSLNGLISSVNSNNGEDYRYGFGTRDIFDENNNLVKTAINFNELASNYVNGGLNDYIKRSSITTLPNSLDPDIAKNLYQASHWVTFINPSFGLEFFEKSSNIIIVHSSDQYTSSSRYDFITVTSRYEQYLNVIEEFLTEKDIKNINPDSLKDLIKLFNSINGEWLIRTISNDDGYAREKLSIISAIKYSLAILEHPEITWIPISMEEILRIAGNAKLSKKEGIFSVKNVSKDKSDKGVHSDDLLFIGVRKTPNDKIEIYYYPIEVKIGNNTTTTINKGKQQIKHTSELLKDSLNSIVESNEFRNKFFRNFFIQILLSNQQKLSDNHIWDDKFSNVFGELKSRLLNDDYDISADLENVIGIGSVVSFKKRDIPFPKIKKEDNIQIIELTERQAYTGLVKSIEEIQNEIQSPDPSVSVDELLSATKDLDSLEHIDFAPTDGGSDDFGGDDSIGHSDPIGGSGSDSTSQPTEEDLNDYIEFLDNQSKKYIKEVDGEFVISRSIKGKNRLFGKFNSKESAIRFEKKIIENAWDDSYGEDIGDFGKFIHKENDEFIIIRDIQGEKTEFGRYSSLIEALNEREALINDYWGLNIEDGLFIDGLYGNHISFFSDVFSIIKDIGGNLEYFGEFDTWEDANKARKLLVYNNWDFSKIPEELFSWRFFSTYTPRMKSWEVSNFVGEDYLSFGFFPSKNKAKKAINILIENNWDSSFVPLELYYKFSNIRFFKKRNIFAVYRKKNHEKIIFSTFDTLEEAIEGRNRLFLSNWSLIEDEDYPNENIYLRSGKYHVKYEIDGVMTTFGIFDTFDEAREYRNNCSRGGWDPSLILISEDDMERHIEEELSIYSDRELDNFEIFNQIDSEFIDEFPDETEEIVFEDILDIFYSIDEVCIPNYPAPQLNSFDQLLNLCEKLYDEGELHRNSIIEIFSLAKRQYSYLTSAGEYLGLINKLESNKVTLTQKGFEIFSLNYSKKMLAIVKSILETKLFNEIFAMYLENDEIPSTDSVSEILVDYNITGTTLRRRASSVRGWISWIVSLYD